MRTFFRRHPVPQMLRRRRLLIQLSMLLLLSLFPQSYLSAAPRFQLATRPSRVQRTAPRARSVGTQGTGSISGTVTWSLTTPTPDRIAITVYNSTTGSQADYILLDSTNGDFGTF